MDVDNCSDSVIAATKEHISKLPVVIYYVNYGTKTNLLSEEIVVSSSLQDLSQKMKTKEEEEEEE
jgi:hypothetical protein